MGNDQGVLWNQSVFFLQYVISGYSQKPISKVDQIQIAPEIQLDLEGGLAIAGFRKASKKKVGYVSQESIYQVYPGRIATNGLHGLGQGKHSLTLKVVIEKGADRYQKILINNGRIKDVKDIRLKIRKDLSVKNMDQNQAVQLIKQSQNVTEAPKGDSVQQMEQQYERLRNKYIVQLNQKEHEIQKKEGVK